jgi:hypothetical protein
MGNYGLTRLTTARTRGKPPPSPIQYSMCLFAAPTPEWLFVPGLPRRSPKLPRFGVLELCETITLCSNLGWGGGLKQSCSSHRELSNGVSHFTCTHQGRVDSWLLVVESQTANLTLGLSFSHNQCCRCPNGSSEPIFDICTSIAFQWYKERPNARCFDLCNRTLNFWESRRTPKSPFWECESHHHTLSK